MAEALKNLYNEKYIDLLAELLTKEFPPFDSQAFRQSIFNSHWKQKELKERMRHIATTIGTHLPQEYPNAIKILKSVFRQMNSAYILENMIFQDFVEVYGLDELDVSLDALETFTVNSSSEFAIRRFLLKYPKESMQQLLKWAKADNEHIRRLASEGSRPRLPWAIALPKFKKDPNEIIKILDILKDDESAYVRKSVANSLNDISKDNPQILKEITSQWIGVSKNRDALLKHGCRTLLKESDSDILNLFGYKNPIGIKLNNFNYDTHVSMGKELTFSFELNAKEALGKLRIEFALDFLRKNGKHNQKVFKISEGDYLQRSKRVSKSYSFKPISTRKYYRGEQRLTLLINGVVFTKVSFMLF